MTMKLAGGCRCGAVTFKVESQAPYPYQLCYCTICRKTGGGGGFAINLAADATTLDVTGRDAIAIYRAEIDHDGQCETSTGERNFCTRCGSTLWLFDPEWPDLIHPFASAIDSDLPAPPDRTHLMLRFKANWVEPAIGPDDKAFDDYPDESIQDWHERHGLWMG